MRLRLWAKTALESDLLTNSRSSGNWRQKSHDEWLYHFPAYFKNKAPIADRGFILKIVS
jgi:hypothetical protein